MISCEIKRNYKVSEDKFQLVSKNLYKHYESLKNMSDDLDINEVYDVQKIIKEKRKNLNILMCGYGFASGGGETFPINLANMMYDRGHNVTFLNFNQTQLNKEVKNMLYPEIPIVEDFRNLNQLAKEHDIDVIHSHHAWVDMTVIDILDKSSNVNHVVSLHGMYENH